MRNEVTHHESSAVKTARAQQRILDARKKEVTHRIKVKVALNIVREFNILATSEKIAKAVAEDHMWREINVGLSPRTDINIDRSTYRGGMVSSSETTSTSI